MDTLTPRFRRASTIAREISSRILEGQWTKRIPTEFELASEFGVARSTVVRSLRQVEQEGLIWCRRGEGRFVVEPRDRRRTATIGVVIHDMTVLSHPVVAQYLSGIHEGCLTSNYHEQIYGFNPRVERNGLAEVIAQLDASKLDGVILLTWLIPEANVIELSHRMPVVNMSRASSSPRVGIASADLVGGAIDAGEHLISLGHRHIGLVTVGPDKLQGWQHREGLRAAMRRVRNGDARAPRVFTSNLNTTSEWVPEFRAAMASPDRPTAVIFGSQDLAAMGLEVAKELNLNVPRDLSVVVSNDMLAPPAAPVPMTAIKIDFTAVGREAVDMLVQMIEQPSVIREPRAVPTELIVRESTAPLQP